MLHRLRAIHDDSNKEIEENLLLYPSLPANFHFNICLFLLIIYSLYMGKMYQSFCSWTRISGVIVCNTNFTLFFYINKLHEEISEIFNPYQPLIV